MLRALAFSQLQRHASGHALRCPRWEISYTLRAAVFVLSVYIRIIARTSKYKLFNAPWGHWGDCMRSGKGKRAQTTTGGDASLKRARASKKDTVSDIEDAPHFTENQKVEIRQSLLDWYDHHHRVLPWRRNPHSKLPEEDTDKESGAPPDMPQQQFIYWVWICEVMSQQTQVSRAAEYFKQWVKTWPTVQDLAQADMEEVNEMWAGLGYYRRARYLLEGAKYVAGDLNGVFPTTSTELQKIPGVGAYTGAAVASIAAGERVAVVDANVMRILARLRCLDWDLKSTKRYSALAATLVDPQRPGDLNQALMELGARICTPHQAPACNTCPIQQHCHAYARQEERGGSGAACSVTDFPIKAVKAKRREETAAVTVVEFQAVDSVFYLLVQRPETGLLAGLWEFPLQVLGGTASDREVQDLMDTYLSDTLQLPVGSGSLEMSARMQLGTIVHIFSHIHLTLRVEKLLLKGQCSLEATERVKEGRPAMKWLSGPQVAAGGLSSSVKKVWALVEKSAQP